MTINHRRTSRQTLRHALRRRRRTPARSRGGLTLLEVVIAGTVSMFLLGVIVTFLTGLMRWEREMRSAADERQAVQDLADRLREDLRSGQAVEQVDNSTLQITTGRGMAIHFALVDEQCIRQEQADVGAARQRAALEFDIGPTAGWQLEEEGDRQLPLVTVWLAAAGASAETSESVAAPVLYVTAAMGAGAPITATRQGEE